MDAQNQNRWKATTTTTNSKHTRATRFQFHDLNSEIVVAHEMRYDGIPYVYRFCGVCAIFPGVPQLSKARSPPDRDLNSGFRSHVSILFHFFVLFVLVSTLHSSGRLALVFVCYLLITIFCVYVRFIHFRWRSNLVPGAY